MGVSNHPLSKKAVFIANKPVLIFQGLNSICNELESKVLKLQIMSPWRFMGKRAHNAVAFLKDYISGTICLIQCKPGCKFKFIACLKIRSIKENKYEVLIGTNRCAYMQRERERL